MEKVIIHHGERVTEHELRDQPLVIGRDPQCDLFFADKKLSRHHARLERAGRGVRLVDLGSRNGSWVNDERVQEREVSPGDEIRLGGLVIQIERMGAARAEEDEESTVYLTGGASPEDTGTVVLDNEQRQAVLGSAGAPTEESSRLAPEVAETQAVGADESATVFLQGGAPPLPPAGDESDATLKKPEPERTVVLESQGSPKSPYDTGSVMFRGTADPSLREAATRVVVPDEEMPADEALEEADRSEPFELPPSTVAGTRVSGSAWAFRFTWIVAGLALFAFAVLALPILRIARLAAADESARHARVLVELLAASNEGALGEGRARDLSVDRALGESGVEAAFILSPAGEILSPRDRSGQTLQIDGVEPLGDVRAFRVSRASNGDNVLAQPIAYRGRRVGVAVLRHRPASALAGSAAATLAFGTLLLLVAVVVAVLLGSRMTLAPIEELRSDIDALAEGGESLATQRPYRELSRLAESVDRLAAQRIHRR